MTSNPKINDLFSMFHDFTITDLTYSEKTLNLTIHIPWGQVWNDRDFKIKLELYGCDFIKCTYGVLIKTKKNLAKYRTQQEYKEKTTKDEKIISALELEIQSHNFSGSNEYVFLCNSSKEDCPGGQLTFTANDFKISGLNGEEITLDQMEIWGEAAWKMTENSWKANEDRQHDTSK